ncbi:MAG: oxidoreductase [Robiginitalea sp.]
MRFYVIVLLLCLMGCASQAEAPPFKKVDIRVLYRDSLSVRALESMPGSVGFGGSGGLFGSVDTRDFSVRTRRLEYQGEYPEFRATGHTATDFFLLSAGSPALLYKTGDKGSMELVYRDHDPEVFYDSMAFWDDLNGLAVGDAMEGCLSMLITRDGGTTWAKVSCEDLPQALPGEGAFAASDTNLAVKGTACWIVTSRGRILYSPDMGQHWEIRAQALETDSETQGLYSMDFYNAQLGYAIGGDYTQPESNTQNKVATEDGGNTWVLRASGKFPGYKSCVQYVPGRGGRDLVAVVFQRPGRELEAVVRNGFLQPALCG